MEENTETFFLPKAKKLLGHIHDINNDLVFVSNLKRLMDEAILENNYKEAIEIYKKWDRSEDILDKFKELEKEILYLNAKEHRPFLLSERFSFLRKSLPDIKKKMGLDVELITDVSSGCMVYSDPQLAKVISENILGNAKKAGATKVRMEYVEHPLTVVISITDNGKGMTKEELRNLGYFSSQKGNLHGYGIQHVRDIIGEAGGHVQWDSMAGVWTKCIITLRKFVEQRKGE